MNRLHSECLKCVLKKYMDKIPEGVSEAEKIEYLQRILKLASEAPMTMSAPVLVRDVVEVLYEMFGVTNEYGEIKKYFNQLMMQYEAGAREKIEESEDSLKLALQYSMTGNYIDFGAMAKIDEDELGALIEKSYENNVDEEEYQNLKEDLKNAKHLVYLTDNCGEIVMDKIFIETLMDLYPELEIKVIVRGEPVLNDVTIEDVDQVGLSNLVTIIENGTGIAGTYMEEINEESRTAMEEADVILSKGQGNFETLIGCGLNVYYIFLCKCDMFAEKFQVEKFSGMLLNDRKCIV